MGDRSAIEWTDATWNPVTGCTKVSKGCKNCYAERIAPRVFAGQTVGVSGGNSGSYRRREFTDVLCHEERLEQPLRWKKPRRIFVNSLSDLFHEDVPDEFIERVFAVMALATQHTFQVLTKRPERMLNWMGDSAEGDTPRWCMVEGQAQKMHHERTGEDPSLWLSVHFPLPNVWLGVSCEDQATADERIPLLLDTPAAVRFVSCEPLLGPIDLSRFVHGVEADPDLSRGDPWLELQHARHGVRLDWVIVGGESGPKARPMHSDWVRQIRDACVEADVPFHFKQWGEWLPLLGHREYLDLPESQRPWIRCDGETMVRVGKKKAGRELDGRVWDGFPA